MNDGYRVVNLGFTFKYFNRDYTQVSISTNGYVCLGENTECGLYQRPYTHDILIGLNYDLDPTRAESGQIYFKNLDSNSSDFQSSKFFLNVLDPEFEPENIFMITYDNVIAWMEYRVSFKIFLSIDSNKKSFVTFKFISCPKNYYKGFGIEDISPSGLSYLNNEGNLEESYIENGQQCVGSNVGQTGVWVKELSFWNISKGNR
jgi:hypothetical protein